MHKQNADVIGPEFASTLDRLFHERVRRTPDNVAYRYFNDHLGEWQDISWAQMAHEIMRWQSALLHERYRPGERVAIMLKNGPTWVAFDIAALGLGLVTVPIYTSDRPDNVIHVLRDSASRLLLIDSAEHWHPLHEAGSDLPDLKRIVTLRTPPEGDDDPRLRGIDEWLPDSGGEFLHSPDNPDALATIVYTSGTTGKSKGVMLSHGNLLSNAWAALQPFHVRVDDIMLSFLPLSHALERMAGYYLAIMAGCTVAYSRSVQQLQEDLAIIRPSILISVPRIFERILALVRNKLDKGPAYGRKLFELAVAVGYSRFEHSQRRNAWHWKHMLWPALKYLVADRVMARLGGNLRLVLCGGAAVSPEISRTFIGLGLPLLQGYGLTETSPVISVNRPLGNLPASVGNPLPGVDVRLGEQDALEVRGANVMLGYWNNKSVTHAMFTHDGWLNTGDVAHIDEFGHITITGRIKDIIVLSNGEKVPPVDLENAIHEDPLFEQVMVVGEGKPYLALFAVVNRERWMAAVRERDLSGTWPAMLKTPQARAFALNRVAQHMKAFPGYARIRRIALLHEPWSLDNGLLTPTLKLKRTQVLERFKDEYASLYEGYNQ